MSPCEIRLKPNYVRHRFALHNLLFALSSRDRNYPEPEQEGVKTYNKQERISEGQY